MVDMRDNREVADVGEGGHGFCEGSTSVMPAKGDNESTEPDLITPAPNHPDQSATPLRIS